MTTNETTPADPYALIRTRDARRILAGKAALADFPRHARAAIARELERLRQQR